MVTIRTAINLKRAQSVRLPTYALHCLCLVDKQGGSNMKRLALSVIVLAAISGSANAAGWVTAPESGGSPACDAP
jgi:hypothetical protein